MSILRAPPTRRSDLAWATIVAIAVGSVVGGALARSASLYASDFTGVWRAAGQVVKHIDPYGPESQGLAYPLGPLAYPLPAVIAALPLGSLPAWLAAGLFVALGAGALTYGALVGPPFRLLILGSPCFVMAASLVQWSPILTASGMLTPLGALAICKPNLGLALLVRQPTKWMLGGGLLLSAISLALLPSWPMEWFQSVRGMSYYHAPAGVIGGPLLLLAALRWRDADARLLLALSVIPSNLMLYDQLPLFLIARTQREMLVLFAGSWLAPIATLTLAPDWIRSDAGLQTFMAAPIVALLFLPALYVVLSRPSGDPSPDLVDRFLNHSIAWRLPR